VVPTAPCALTLRYVGRRGIPAGFFADFLWIFLRFLLAEHRCADLSPHSVRQTPFLRFDPKPSPAL